MNNFVEELRWRGLLQDQTPGTEEFLLNHATVGYVGFDPTAVSLHIGNLVPIMLLKHFQRAGHKPIALVGGATGMVGDPSGKSEERNLLDEETLRRNQEGIRQQLGRFLDFEGDQAAEIVNNYDWFKEFGFLEFLRDVGKHLTVNYMMAKDSVKKRLETGISFTEFSYQLLQGYDFQWLYKNKGCRLQMGGSDQWGNITTGTELIRRMSGSEEEAPEVFALTAPLLTKADGQKFGKSERGNVWLDPEMTSPYQFYQFWLNAADADAPRLMRVFSLKSRDEIEALEAEHAEAPHRRTLQRALAEEMTARVHSEADLQQAVQASEILFGKGTTEVLKTISEKLLLDVFEGVPQVEVEREAVVNAADLPEVLSVVTQQQIFKSKGEARRMLTANGVSINKEKVSADVPPAQLEWLQGRYLLVQKGKKDYFLIRAN
ncbi:tyrosyl-tRNA synthetase [Catalinimonas alkaloidigena]|uniref:Tyrosine--tRNA ligase n=1 Tax=Catalinimonas alkaloidigena TaxID=1075417 RepID=A0A1G9GV88_9BACT|nr:tyrosine--tRNA ligase [Catalinimonas alkaloidigena]SDL04591.1 tyrosyl-tRNA synthetase [Catalinimonas alkaloidigena]